MKRKFLMATAAFSSSNDDQKINPRFGVLAIFILAVAVLRISNAAIHNPLSNFTPIGAMGLFGGAYFSSKWKGILFPLLTLLVSDLLINQFLLNGKYGILYSGWYWVYGVFALIGLAGNRIIQPVTIKNVLIAGLVASLGHWLLLDFIVWAGGGTDIRTGLPLSRDWMGLQQCYLQGLPFFKNFLAGTLVYSALLFGTFEWMKSKIPALVYNKTV